MRLANIREQKAGGPGTDRSGRVAKPRNPEAARRLFGRGLEALQAGEERDAFAAFDCLAGYTGDAPDGLVAAAALGRELTDPDRTPEERADQFFDLFPGRVAHVFDAHADGGSEGPDRDPDPAERGQAVMTLDPPTTAWLVRNDLFAAAFRSLERGDLGQADRAFAEFLDRTADDPSAALRATVMLARAAIDAARSGNPCRPDPGHIVSQCVVSVIQARR